MTLKIRESGPDSGSGAHSPRLRVVALGVFLFVAGTLVGVFVASLPMRNRVSTGGAFPGEFFSLVGIGSLTWYACLLSSPLYVWLARRFPIYPQHWLRNLALHVLVTVGLILLSGLIFFQMRFAPASAAPPPAPAGEFDKSLAQRSAAPRGGRGPDLAGFLLLRLVSESLPFAAMIALIHAFEIHRRHRQRQVETARLQTQLAEARLEALTAQLQPHFLFNTLQGISTLMHRDVKSADAMLSQLSDLLRRTLQRGERQESPLSEELEMLGHYVEISRERFKDRFVFETQISPETRHALVPFFILQPLVENALQHGIAQRTGAGRVSVTATRRAGTLHLNVTDDGPGWKNDDRTLPREGIGLSNTRQRLRQLYGDQQRLTLETPAEGGLRVELVIPYREAPGPAVQEAAS